MIYLRTEYSQVVCICFITKSPLNPPRFTFNFSKKLYFQTNNSIVSMLYTLIEHALSTALSARVISELYYIKKKKNSISQIRLCLLILFVLHWKFSTEKESYWLNSDWISVRMTAKWPVCRRVDHGWQWIDNLCRRVDITIGHQMYSFHFFFWRGAKYIEPWGFVSVSIFIFGNSVLIVAYFIYFRSHWKCYHITASVLNGS